MDVVSGNNGRIEEPLDCGGNASSEYVEPSEGRASIAKAPVASVVTVWLRKVPPEPSSLAQA